MTIWNHNHFKSAFCSFVHANPTIWETLQLAGWHQDDNKMKDRNGTIKLVLLEDSKSFFLVVLDSYEVPLAAEAWPI